MPKTRNRESFIGRRLRLKDLQVFMAVVRSGSMAKAADQLGISQPAISEVISGLEHALRVKLFDRNPRGVELTAYGRALLKRGVAVFDELTQGLVEIEDLADPGAGEVRIGCPDSISSAIMPAIIRQFKQKYPRVVLQVDSVSTLSMELPQLRDRSLDLVIARVQKPVAANVFSSDLNVEILFEDHVVVAAGLQSRWAKRRHVDLAELVDEPWIVPNSRAGSMVGEACRAKGLKEPNVSLVTYSVHLRAELAATGDYLTSLPASVLYFNAERFALKVLPVELPSRPFPVVMLTLKNRTLSPVVQRFIDHVKAFTKPLMGYLARTTRPG
jgi:DNA-binding transcriptional LysR family regulator